ncbi:MAG: acyltransferase family protein [Cyanobacteria bacterium P01_D01_bin.44]
MHPTPPKRLAFIDNLRVMLIMLVVAHHAAQPYGPTGGEWPIFNPERAPVLGPFFAVNAAFFMGLFFFISGYFLPAAYDRKGVKLFLKSRFKRLGIPLLFFALVVFPPVLYKLAAPPVSFLAFFTQVYINQLEIEVAHLWFLMHLLFYALVYALWRKVSLPVSPPPGLDRQVPSQAAMLAYLVGLTAVTFIVRIDYPIDRWVNIFGFLPAEVAHLPQYSSLFVLGIMAYRHHWLERMATSQGFTWLGIGLGAALLRYAYSLNRDRLALPDAIEGGGLSWQSLIWSGWEATICMGLCIGLLILFREKINFQGNRLRILADNVYMVYLIHLLWVIYLQFTIASLSIGPFAKFGLVTLMGIPISFAFSSLLRRLPWVKAIVF